MSYSYARFGNSCVPHTSALTSNAKYIQPSNSVYQKTWTPMMHYPGYLNNYTLEPDKLFDKEEQPKSVKAFEIDEIKNNGNTESSCKTCGM